MSNEIETDRLLAGGRIDVGDLITASKLEPSRYVSVKATDPENTPILGVAKTATGPGNFFMVSNVKIVAVRLDSNSAAELCDTVEKSSLENGCVQIASKGKIGFGQVVSKASPGDYINILLIMNS